MWSRQNILYCSKNTSHIYVYPHSLTYMHLSRATPTAIVIIWSTPWNYLNFVHMQRHTIIKDL